MQDDDPEANEAGTFTPESLDRTVLALPLLRAMEQHADALHPVVVEVNLDFPASRADTRALAKALIEDAIARAGSGATNVIKPRNSEQYVFARLEAEVIREVVRLNEARERPIFRIWPDFPINRL
ncbi:MAG: hypothetical protein ACXW61_18765 [Gemmatirosa sp.]